MNISTNGLNRAALASFRSSTGNLMPILPDLMVLPGTRGTARPWNLDAPLRPGAHRAAGPVECISQPAPLPQHADSAQSPFGTGKGRFLNPANRSVVESVYFETVTEAFGRRASVLTAHIEAVIAAAMLLACLTGIENETAKHAIVGLGLRPNQL